MPQLSIKGVKKEEIAAIAPAFVEELAKVIDCPADWLVLDVEQTTFFDGNGETPYYPVVQVWWYKREQDVQDKTARVIGDMLLGLGYETVQISFHELHRDGFYEFEKE